MTKHKTIKKIVKGFSTLYDIINPPPKEHNCKICGKKIYSKYKLCFRCYEKYQKEEQRER